MALEINAAFVRNHFGNSTVTPEQTRYVHQAGPGAVITADLGTGCYRAHAPGELDPNQNARLVVFTHHDVQLLLNRQCDHVEGWEATAQEVTRDLRRDMRDWPGAWFVSDTVVALRAALSDEGFYPHTRPYATSLGEARASQIFVFGPDPRVLLSTNLPCLNQGPVECEARLMTTQYSTLTYALGPVCSDTATGIARGLATETRKVLTGN